MRRNVWRMGPSGYDGSASYRDARTGLLDGSARRIITRGLRARAEKSTVRRGHVHTRPATSPVFHVSSTLRAVSRERRDRPVCLPTDQATSRSHRTRRDGSRLFARNLACSPGIPTANSARTHRRVVRLQQLLRFRRRRTSVRKRTPGVSRSHPQPRSRGTATRF